VSRIETDLRTHNSQTDHGLLSSINNVGIAGMFADRSNAASAMVRALREPTAQTVRLLGLSLDDFMRPGDHSELHQTWRVLEEQIRAGRRADHDSHPLDVKVLVIDPNCVGAQLMCYDSTPANRHEQINRLRNDVEYTVRRLQQLEALARTGPDDRQVTFELRLYRLPPHIFLCATNSTAFTHTYYLPRKGDTITPAPVFRLDAGSPLHDRVTAEFELIWQAASVPASAARSEYVDGLDRGASQSGMHSIYTDPRRARERIIHLIKHAQHRVWIQGVSLYPMLMSQVTRAIEAAIHRGTVDVRLLILDPDCEQAMYKTYREYAERVQEQPSHELWQEYRENPAVHHRSQLYHNIRESVRRATELGEEATPAGFAVRLYDSAPGAYILIVDDHALVEQYHYGAAPRIHRSPLELAEEMPLIEYQMGASGLFAPQESFQPFTVLEDHFTFVFDCHSKPVGSAVADLTQQDRPLI